MSRKKKKTKASSRRSPSLKKGRWLLLASLMGITLFCVYFALRLPPKENHTSKYVISHDGHLSPKRRPQYEEKEPPDIHFQIKEIDLAILQALVQSKLENHNLVHVDIEEKKLIKGKYLYQVLQVRGNTHSFTIFIKELKKYLALVKGARLTNPKKYTYIISINQHPTHEIHLGCLAPIPSRKKKKGYLFIIIDDMGRDVGIARSFIKTFGKKITLSILPYERHSLEIERMSEKAHVEILLHMPMEPLDYPRANPGPGALFVDMTPTEIQEATIRALHRVPHAIGVNNHMGSKFTQDLQGMKIFLSIIKTRGLFFIDSSTTPFSVAPRLGRALHLSVYKRDIFLDNSRDPLNIAFQLKKAEMLSRKKGWAIAIGHPYKETLLGLKLWLRTKGGNTYLLPVSKLKKIAGKALSP